MSAFPDVPSWYMELSAQGQEDAMRFIHAHDSLRAELAASESLVSALQEQMARLAEQHAKAVAEAREEQRAAGARAIEVEIEELRVMWKSREAMEAAARCVRSTPLDSTPLAARIAELEALLRTEKEWTAAFKKDAAATAEYELKWNTERRRADVAESALASKEQALVELRRQAGKAATATARAIERAVVAESALAAEVERHQATAKVLEEVYEYLEWEYQVDPMAGYDFELAEKTRKALASLPAGPREVR